MISAIVLAAGKSERMGRPKLLLEVGGRSLIRIVVDNALRAAVDEVIVVVGAHADAIRRALDGFAGGADCRLRIVENAQFERGQSTSLRAGLAALDGRSEAALVLMGDQPFVTPAVIDALIARYLLGDVPLVYPRYAGQRGTPVLLARALFPELMALTGDQGGRSVVAKYLSRGAPVDVASPVAALDVDTWEDYLHVSKVEEG